jgi:ABC-type amino acid transport substrate-binding protein
METVRIDFDARYPPFETTTAHGQLVGFDTDLTGQAPRA